jgi:hypothetical protein
MRTIVVLVVGCSVYLCGFSLSHAQAPTRPGGAESASVLNASVKSVVDEICSDGGEWLKCYSLDPSRCASITAGFVEPCVKTVVANGSKDPAVHPIATLLGCFNQEFMRKYGHGEVKTPECATPLKHLMGPAN